jgi:hypothetical protein
VKLLGKLARRARNLLPVHGYYFDRPLLLLQSDDWGRVGLRDQQGLKQLETQGLHLGERPYDFYTFETTQDLAALSQLLKRHRDATGRPACIGMNFIVANLDFARMSAQNFQNIHLRALSDGLPDGWERPGLLEAYQEGIGAGVFYPALHGQTHFCRQAVERELNSTSERVTLIKTLWSAGTPYIHWRMPWIGYECWDPERSNDDRFLSREEQEATIGSAVGIFARMFSTLPRSACAPGYRADETTHRTWAHFGVRVAQNGPRTSAPPHLDRFSVLHLYRTLDFEPALDDKLSVSTCVDAIARNFQLGLPAIISIHSINFHSTVKDFRTKTLTLLDELLSVLETKFPNLLYLHDSDIYDLTQSGSYSPGSKPIAVGVTRRAFRASPKAQ